MDPEAGDLANTDLPHSQEMSPMDVVAWLEKIVREAVMDLETGHLLEPDFTDCRQMLIRDVAATIKGLLHESLWDLLKSGKLEVPIIYRLALQVRHQERLHIKSQRPFWKPFNPVPLTEHTLQVESWVESHDGIDVRRFRRRNVLPNRMGNPPVLLLACLGGR